MSKSVFTNVNTLFQDPSTLSGSFPYENTETDGMKQKQNKFMEGQKGSPFSLLVKMVVYGLFPFRLIVNNPLRMSHGTLKNGRISNKGKIILVIIFSSKKPFRIPNLTFLIRLGTHLLCPIIPLFVKYNYFNYGLCFPS